MRFFCLVDSGRRGVQVKFILGPVFGLDVDVGVDVVVGDDEEGRRGEDAQFPGRI